MPDTKMRGKIHTIETVCQCLTTNKLDTVMISLYSLESWIKIFVLCISIYVCIDPTKKENGSHTIFNGLVLIGDGCLHNSGEPLRAGSCAHINAKIMMQGCIF